MMHKPLIALALLLASFNSSAAQWCPNPSGGFTIALTGSPRMMTFDSFQNQMTFFWTTQPTGLTQTFIDVDQTVAQQCSVTKDGPTCLGMVMPSNQQLVLNRMWNCPIQLVGGGLLQSVIP